MARPQRCQHLKSNGRRCASPAANGKRLCYFHHRARSARPRLGRAQRPPLLPDFPVIEDSHSVLLALNQVIQAVCNRDIEPEVAGRILFALQTATSKLDPEPPSPPKAGSS